MTFIRTIETGFSVAQLSIAQAACLSLGLSLALLFTNVNNAFSNPTLKALAYLEIALTQEV